MQIDNFDKNQIKFFISNIALFAKLKSREINALLKMSEIKEYKNNEIIYEEGSSPDYFYLLIRGRVVASVNVNHRETQIELLKRGTVFGIISLFTEEDHSVTAKSIEDSAVLIVEKEKFKSFLRKYPLIAVDFFRVLSQRVKKRSQPKKIFRSKKVSVVHMSSFGKSTYGIDLGLKIGKQTKKRVICLELSSEDNFAFLSLMQSTKPVLNLKEFSDETIGKYIISADIDYLLVMVNEGYNFESLLNYLSENYHYVIYDIPYDLLKGGTNDLISSTNEMHLLIDYKTQESDMSCSAIVDIKAQAKGLDRKKIKVIVYDYEDDGRQILKENGKCLSRDIHAVIPSCESSEYFPALQRIARETGDMVLGLAFGGGGAFSFAQIGVLKVLEEAKIPIDVISGSSMGAFIAALWAMGYSIKEIERYCSEFGKRLGSFSFKGFSFSFKGVLQSNKLKKFLKNIFGDKTFYDLKHTLNIVVFDFLKRESLILDEGLVYEAVAASCAYPGIFEPVKLKKGIFLDGGILSPLPTDALLRYGANKIIAVNINPSKSEVVREYKKKNKLHILDFVFGSIETMQRTIIKQAIKAADVIIHPQMKGLFWMQFSAIDEIVKRGETASFEKLTEIRELVES